MNKRLELVILAAGLISALVDVLLDGAILTVAAVILNFYADHHAVFQAVVFLVLTLAIVFVTAVFCQWRGISLIREEKKP